MFFTIAPILQVPVNVALGSIEILPVIISPNTLAVAFNTNNSLDVTTPFISPDTSAFWHVTLPSILPVFPTTNLPVIVMFPFNVPSIRTSPFDVISPIIDVFIIEPSEDSTTSNESTDEEIEDESND